MNIGFIGLGKMGSGLAKNLIRAGYNVMLYDISLEAVNRVLQLGGNKADSAKEIALNSDIVFTSLPLPTHLVQLTIEENGILQHMRERSLLVDVSTVDPVTAKKIEVEAERVGVQFLACPLGKGPTQAEEGIEPIFVGGKQDIFETYRELLSSIGKPVYIGSVEQSTAFKLISNMVGMANLSVISEGFILAANAGIDLSLFKELLHDTGADSAQLRLRGPLLLKDEFTPMFSVNLAEKDVRLGVNMAESMDVNAEFSKLALNKLQGAQVLQHGDLDCAALYKTFMEENVVKNG